MLGGYDPARFVSERIQVKARDGALIPISRVEIVNQWSMWWGVAMMVAGSLTTLLAKPDLFLAVFKTFRKKEPGKCMVTGKPSA